MDALCDIGRKSCGDAVRLRECVREREGSCKYVDDGGKSDAIL